VRATGTRSNGLGAGRWTKTGALHQIAGRYENRNVNVGDNTDGVAHLIAALRAVAKGTWKLWTGLRCAGARTGAWRTS